MGSGLPRGIPVTYEGAAMVHLGDIKRISSYTAPPVDVVIGGSPCQDLSAAGKRAGLAGARSGLFMEQIRVVKELRDADIQRGRTGQFVRPRFMVWEQVPGAFSSNKGEDFRAVLEETIRVAEPDAPDVPLPPQGRWPLADCWYGDGWSVAYRVLDAQFWGVPQRRRRIALVADFGGHAAPEILFVRQGVRGDTAPGGAAGEEAAAGAGSGAGQAGAYRIGAYYSAGMLSDNPKAGIIPVEQSNTLDCNGGAPTSQQGGVCIVQPVICLNDQGGSVMGTSIDVAGTLRAQEHGHQPVICAGFQHQAGAKTRGIGFEEEQAPTLVSGQLAAVYDARGNGDGKTACALTVDRQSRVTDHAAIVMATGQTGAEITQDASPTLNCNHEQPIVAHSLRAQGNDPHRADAATYPVTGGIARRLTPLECERLQGFPDGWTDIGPWTDSAGKLHRESSDSSRYKALGNSIALPPWKWVLKRLCACYERDATMASLFDGIGGFPLIWERLNGPGSCLWASEIEEFPLAVTRRHFEEVTERL